MDEVETALQRLSIRAPGQLLDVLLADQRGLGRAVKQTLPAERAELVLVIDQFEELFTLTAPADRNHFLEALASAVTDPNSRLRVIATLRADFFDRPLQHPAISELVRANTVAVSPLSGSELEAAITAPASHVGVGIDPALVAELMIEVMGQPASLPLLQYVLTEVFERRVDDQMTLEAYREVGGIAGALANRADRLLDELGTARVPDTRRLFTRLISLGEGSEDTRRRVLGSELSGIDESVIDAYGAARLLTFDHDPATREPTVEVAHEALIREWPRFRLWLDEDRDGLRLLRHLGVAAQGWDQAGRPDSELYRGGRLEAAQEWAADHGVDLTGLEAAYLETSSQRRTAEELEERRRVTRLHRLLQAMALIAFVALVAGAIAFQQRALADRRAGEAQVAEATAERSAELASTREREAIESQQADEIGRLSSEAAFRVQSDRQTGLLLAVEAFRRDEGGPVSLGGLQRALTGVGNYLGTLDGGRSYATVDWLDDGRIVAAGADGLAVIDAESAVVADRWTTPIRVITVDSQDGSAGHPGVCEPWRRGERSTCRPAITTVSKCSGWVRAPGRQSIDVPETGDAYGLSKIDTVRWDGGEAVWVLLSNGRLLDLRLDDGTEDRPPIDTQLPSAADAALAADGKRVAVAGASGIAVFALDGSGLLARGIDRQGTQLGSISPDGTRVTQDYASGEEWTRPGQIYDISGPDPVAIARPDDLRFGYDDDVVKVVTRSYGLRILDGDTLEPLRSRPRTEPDLERDGHLARPHHGGDG